MNGAVVIEGHVQGLSNTRALGEAGIPVIVIDRDLCLARYSRYCKKFFRCPDYRAPEFVPFLLDLARKENLQGWMLLPSNDHAVHSIAVHRKELLKYYKVLTPPAGVIENIYDKAKLLDLAEKAGVACPSTVYFKTPEDKPEKSLSYPVLTKGRNGLTFYRTMGKKAFFAGDESELKAQLRTISEKIPVSQTFTQEVIPFDGTNKTISFTAFSIGGDIKTCWAGEKIREHPLRFGTATMAVSIPGEGLLEPAGKLLRALNYTGICEIEFLLDPRDRTYKLIEINARTWLWVGLAKHCGVNYALIAYNYLNELENNYPQSYTTGIKWINYLTDIPFSLSAIIRRKLRLSAYFSSLRGKKCDAFFSMRDPLPAVMFFFLSVYIAIKRR